MVRRNITRNPSYNPKRRASVGVFTERERAELASALGVPQVTSNDFIKNVLQRVFTVVVEKGTEWIETYVPIAEGQLQESLIKNLNDSRSLVNNYKLNLTVGSFVHYIQYVAQMNGAKVKHYGERRRINYPGARYNNPIYRNVSDPQAKGFFFEKLIRYLRSVMREELHTTINNYARLYGFDTRTAMDKFTMEEMNNAP